MTDRRILFSGEMQLCRWSESSTNGATVTMWVHPEDLDSFKSLKARSGKHAGQRLACVLVELDDEEAVVQQPETPAPTESPSKTAPGAVRKYPKPTAGEQALWAVGHCRNGEFQEWVSEVANDVFLADCAEHGLNPHDTCKAFILAECGITADRYPVPSRKYLDLEEHAEQLQRKIKSPFARYLLDKGMTR